MRTTLDLPDTLLKEAKITAVQRGVTLRELFTQALRAELAASGAVSPDSPYREGSPVSMSVEEDRPGRRLRFPLIPSQNPGALTGSEALLRTLEEEEIR